MGASRPPLGKLRLTHWVKQQLAAVRMLFDWLITGQIVPHNSAAAVHGLKHVVKTGKTPVLEGSEWRELLDFISQRRARNGRRTEGKPGQQGLL